MWFKAGSECLLEDVLPLSCLVMDVRQEKKDDEGRRSLGAFHEKELNRPQTCCFLPFAGVVESLSDVDDEELECYLLDAEEKQHKSDIWHEAGAVFCLSELERGAVHVRKQRACSDLRMI